jgi:DNA replication and repair protein RecF
MLEKILLYNYRNIGKSSIHLSEGINLLVAPNGYGKTNLIESIYYSVFRTSFRPIASYQELIGTKDEFAKITLDWDSAILETVMGKDNSHRRKITLNGKVGRRKEILERFPAILFAPHSVDLVNGEPKIRRSDFDAFLMLYKSGYDKLLGSYNTVLKNRNSVIKAIQEGHASKDELSFWTKKLIEHGTQITSLRSTIIDSINQFVPAYSNSLYHSIKSFSIKYTPNLEFKNIDEIEDIYSKKYEENMEKEIIVGKTLYGPHKDDYTFIFVPENSSDKLSLRFHGSRGQQRIGSLLVKLGQLSVLETVKEDHKVLLLLDDIMSELDDDHRKNVAKLILEKDYQCLITGADIHEIPDTIRKVATTISLS